MRSCSSRFVRPGGGGSAGSCARTPPRPRAATHRAARDRRHSHPRRTGQRAAAGILFVLVAADVAGAAQRTRVIVAPESVVQGAAIRLGDIAAIDGEGAEALAAIGLGSAPAAGE